MTASRNTEAAVDPAAPAFRACRDITFDRARHFALGLRLCPEPRRSALYAFYSWSRLGDDLADEPGNTADERLAALASFRNLTTRAASQQAEDSSPVWKAMDATLASYPIDPAWLHEMIDGFESDARGEDPETEADLNRYCHRVAGTVGMTCVAVWGLAPGAKKDEALALADLRGRAFQLTNIARDIAEDAALSPTRCYIPKSVLAEHGITASQLADWSSPAACERVVHWLTDRARAAYTDSARLESLINRQCRPVLTGLTGIYQLVLAQLEADPSRAALGPRPRVGKAARFLLAARAIASRWLKPAGRVVTHPGPRP